ncbi:aminodeoxychorismate synthase component I [uncultured Clostridium sp.]|uniref:aminodeoxychorismate synthase component I n=1 Tax=uncultured Clostridium sp. TaxID=59620 RepID=UPI0025E52D74|nr:aminodeoxychorismate synthase component I [uncultured Clostridium sp.]
MGLIKIEFNSELNAFEVYNLFKNQTDTILLDSSKEDKNLSKYSFIGVNPFLKFEVKNENTYINGNIVEGDPFKILENLVNEYRYDIEDNIPLLSGAMGYISYDTGRLLEELPNTAEEDFNIPDMRFVFYKNIIIFDLINDKKYITDLDGNIENIHILLKVIDSGEKIHDEIVREKSENNFYSNFIKEDYKKAVTRLKEYIVSGDVYIANMTQRFWCHNEEDSFNIYKKLRSINKAPFSAYLNFEDFQIISSSPERFVQVFNNKAHTRPIKGTRPRGNNVEEDEKNKLELIDSEKDKAELLMVVDLERNDFSKVCKPHTVKVTENFKLEEYATVFHLVSTVEGELKDNVSSVRCIKECFPGGSITGTPKIRAMEIIEELEGIKRNIYTGSIGYFDFRGNCDFNIVIRTIIKKNNKAYFGVGGGITYDSIEEDEYSETLDKAKALMRVL